jgi:hypothetical protein
MIGKAGAPLISGSGEADRFVHGSRNRLVLTLIQLAARGSLKKSNLAFSGVILRFGAVALADNQRIDALAHAAEDSVEHPFRHKQNLAEIWREHDAGAQESD